MIVYHYTTKTAMDLILSNKQFLPSVFSRALDYDPAYGNGFYFTNLAPNNDDKTLYQLWGAPEPEKVKNYIVFDIDDSLLTLHRPYVYKLDYKWMPQYVIDITKTYQKDNQVVIKYVRTGNRVKSSGQFNTLLGFIFFIGAIWLISKL
jgi:hypothetical protein